MLLKSAIFKNVKLNNLDLQCIVIVILLLTSYLFIINPSKYHVSKSRL